MSTLRRKAKLDQQMGVHMLDKNLHRVILVTAVIALTTIGGSAGARAEAPDDDVKRISLLWYIGGTQRLFECQVPPTDRGTTDASCHRHQLLDLRRDRVIGVALDATADAETAGDAITATGTTTFVITRGPFRGSRLQLRGTGTIQPVLTGDPTFEWTSRSAAFDETPITHIAGIFPNPDDNQVLAGAGAFYGATGTFALFGGLNLSESERATFNCIYKIDLEIPRSTWNWWFWRNGPRW